MRSLSRLRVSRDPFCVHVKGLAESSEGCTRMKTVCSLTALCNEDEPMATWSHERLLRRPQTPQTKDSLRRRTWDVQDPSGPYLQREPLLGQTLREQSRPRGVAGTEEEPGIIPEAGREGQEATGGRSPRAPLSPLPASRTAVSTWRPCDGVLREPLYHVPTMCLPCAVEEPGLARPAKRGTRSAAERDEFRRAAWRAPGV